MAGKITLAFVGDVMLGRGVDEEIEHRKPEYFWGTTLPVLRSADAVIANLECAITDHTIEWQGPPKAFYFRASPKAIDVLRAANIRCVSLANNHILDFEEQGLSDTLQYLDEAGISHAGAGKNLDEARRPAIINVNGIALAIIAATDNEPDFAANANPGTNYIEIGTDTATLLPLEQGITSARQMGAQNIILSLHWGPNMVVSPPQHFRDFARAVTDLGIDILHGHSAHIFQAVETYKRRLIMYDAGDFIDDYAIDPILRNDWSFIFLVNISAEGAYSLTMLPVVLSYAQVNLATGAQFRMICDRMKHLCERFNTRVIDAPQGLEIPLK
ncbi:MAG: CapA family protein [Candidatus Aquicultor sp.]